MQWGRGQPLPRAVNIKWIWRAGSSTYEKVTGIGGLFSAFAIRHAAQADIENILASHLRPGTAPQESQDQKLIPSEILMSSIRAELLALVGGKRPGPATAEQSKEPNLHDFVGWNLLAQDVLRCENFCSRLPPSGSVRGLSPSTSRSYRKTKRKPQRWLGLDLFKRAGGRSVRMRVCGSSGVLGKNQRCAIAGSCADLKEA